MTREDAKREMMFANRNVVADSWIDQAYDVAIKALSEPEQKKGEWINRSLNIMYPEWERYTCSVCGKHSNNYDFCPNCGADMRGGENA